MTYNLGHFEYLVTSGDSRYCEVIACSFRSLNLLLWQIRCGQVWI